MSNLPKNIFRPLVGIIYENYRRMGFSGREAWVLAWWHILRNN